jgi:hypothetical protein
MGDSFYSPHVLEQKAKEVNDDLRTALILGLLGLLCFGFILGFLAYRRASHAVETIDVYGVMRERRTMGTALRILGIFDIVASAIVLLGRFYLR